MFTQNPDGTIHEVTAEEKYEQAVARQSKLQDVITAFEQKAAEMFAAAGVPSHIARRNISNAALQIRSQANPSAAAEQMLAMLPAMLKK